MDRKPHQQQPFVPAYRSGTAARLAGIPVETLRVWERRYAIVGAPVAPRGHRLYSPEDVSRLALIKQLVDLGSPIGSIAGLPFAALRAMRDSADAASLGTLGPAAAAEGARRPVRVALVGEGFAGSAADLDSGEPPVQIVASCEGVARAPEVLRGIPADLLVIELPTLHDDALGMVEAVVRTVAARAAIVAYRFGPAAVVEMLRERGHSVVRLPLDGAELARHCRDAVSRAVPPERSGEARRPLETVPPRRFDDHLLARLARAPTAVYCECPRQLIELLRALGSFERYSAECENRSTEDAALHRYLKRVAGTSRVLFEEALERVGRAEGLALTPDTRDANL